MSIPQKHKVIAAQAAGLIVIALTYFGVETTDLERADLLSVLSTFGLVLTAWLARKVPELDLKDAYLGARADLASARRRADEAEAESRRLQTRAARDAALEHHAGLHPMDARGSAPKPHRQNRRERGAAAPQLLTLVAVLTVALLALPGCKTALTADATTQLAIQYGTLKLLENQPDAPEKAQRIREKLAIARDRIAKVNDVTAASALADRLREDLGVADMAPSDQLLVNGLLNMLQAELDARIAASGGLLSSGHLIPLADAVEWVDAIASRFTPVAAGS